jgi:hypothetical protein
MPREVARPARAAVRRDAGRRRDEHASPVGEMPGGERRIGRAAVADGDVQAFADWIAEEVVLAQVDLDPGAETVRQRRPVR